MNVRRLVSMSLVVSLFAGLLPSVVFAREEKAATPATDSATAVAPVSSVDLRASANQVVAQMSAERQQPAKAGQPARHDASPSPQYGGGGGAGMWIMMAVGAAVSIGMAYYLIKQTKKVQTQAQNQ